MPRRLYFYPGLVLSKFSTTKQGKRHSIQTDQGGGLIRLPTKAMQSKRQRPLTPEADGDRRPPTKRPRLSPPPPPTPTSTPARLSRLERGRRTGPDLLSALSDELLVRILSFLSLPHLLAVAPASRRLDRLAADSQLWKALYYGRFVLPRAMRIPGFRADGRGAAGGHKLHYSGRRTLWADGRRGGVVVRESAAEPQHDRVNWKRQYRLRHNWARGKCAVEELRIGDETAEAHGRCKMLVKVVEGVAITADKASGLRAWDLRTRGLLAHSSLRGSEKDGEEDPAPSCLAVDEGDLDDMAISVAAGFLDGSFGVWRLDIGLRQLVRQYRHEKSTGGELIGMALSYPYLLTATESVLVSLYTFQIPSNAVSGASDQHEESHRRSVRQPGKGSQGIFSDVTPAEGNDPIRAPGGVEHEKEATPRIKGNQLPAPYLLTSLRSHTSRPPLALSIRRTATTTIASIAYTFSTRRGWSIGLQDLHIKHASAELQSAPEITTTRLAYTTPIDAGFSSSQSHPSSPPATPPRRQVQRPPTPDPTQSSLPRSSQSPSTPTTINSRSEPGPTTLCYTHPYLLATLPDNTLVLHLCTSTASSLDVSPGLRLWGHTSGVAGAEITARGKAVSVCERGGEIRVWELEGRAAGLRGGGRSIQIRPGQSPPSGTTTMTTKEDGGGGAEGGEAGYGWDERRNWVGFDDEMVIVLKERKCGSESLMVYDFT